MRIFLIALLLGQTLLISCSSDGMYSAAPERSIEDDYLVGEAFAASSPTTEAAYSGNYDFADEAEYNAKAGDSHGYTTTVPQSTEPEQPSYQQPVLLRTANTRMQVDNIRQKVQHIESLLAQKSGYVANLEWRNYSYQEEAQLNLRIPAVHFNWLLDTIASLAVEVNFQEVNTQDVTEEYVDLQSRLKTKKAVRDRYEEILRTKATTVEDILKTEEQLRRLQEEIEAKEGRLRYLAQRAEFSTISLQLYEHLEETAGTPWWQAFGENIGNSLAFSLNLIKQLFLGMLSLWPVLLLLVWLIWRRKKIWQRIRPSRTE